MSKPYICYDTETDSTRKDAQIIQLAAIAIQSGEVLSTFNRKLKFDVNKADPDALKMNHYSAEAWAEAIEQDRCAWEFAKWLNGYKCIEKTAASGRKFKVAKGMGFNSQDFDKPLIQELFKKANPKDPKGLFLPMDYKDLDVMHLSDWYLEFFHDGPLPENRKLTTLVEFFDLEVKDAHDALGDCYMTAALGRALLERMMQ
jgi:DNA polymerase III epsilon subunit-like protein